MIKYKNILDIIFYNCLIIYTQIKLLYIYLFQKIEMIDTNYGLCKIGNFIIMDIYILFQHIQVIYIV